MFISRGTFGRLPRHTIFLNMRFLEKYSFFHSKIGFYSWFNNDNRGRVWVWVRISVRVRVRISVSVRIRVKVRVRVRIKNKNMHTNIIL